MESIKVPSGLCHHDTKRILITNQELNMTSMLELSVTLTWNFTLAQQLTTFEHFDQHNFPPKALVNVWSFRYFRTMLDAQNFTRGQYY